MFQTPLSPFGGVSIIVSLIVVIVGSTVRFVVAHTRRSGKRVCTFFSYFTSREHDSSVRRMIAYVIPVFVLAAVSSIMAYNVERLFNDEHRYGVIEMGHELTQLDAFNEALAFMSSPYLEPDVSRSDPPMELMEERSQSSPPDTTANDNAPVFVEGQESDSLSEFLERNGLPSDTNSRREVARWFGLTTYTGTIEENAYLLKRLRELTIAEASQLLSDQVPTSLSTQ